MGKNWRFITVTLACALISLNTWATDNAVILLYHHVSSTTPKSTSVSEQTFRQHMQHLADNHKVLPLKHVIEALRVKQPLPNNTVVITFDDGYDNIYVNAHPILREFAFPYTIFVNPPLIGEVNYQLDWQQIKQMSKENVSFANHGKQHNHMLGKRKGESQQDWLNRTMQEIEEAEKMLQQQIGYSLKYFAYPYGEFDAALKQRLSSKGYVGFAQHSGAIASYSDFSALPRYPAAGVYSNLKTLAVKLNSLAMPVTNNSIKDPKAVLPFQDPTMTFDVKTADMSPLQITCFQNGQPLTKGVAESTVSVQINSITQAGRHRVNCTAPSKNNKGRFYWYSQPFFIPTSAGNWLD